MIKTPKEMGFFMPAEWEKHSAVWMAWPYDNTTFPNLIPEVEKTYCQIIKSLEESEKVNLIVLDKDKERVKKILADYENDLDNITFYIEDYVDVWTRDYTPITILNKNENKLAFVKWDYDAYGKGHDPYFADLLKDDKVFDNILSPSKNEIFRPGIVLEGGAIDSNGNGTILTTEQCLLNLNRNPELNKEKNEQYLKDYLGVENIIWLKDGLINDHTDGHIDEIARFVATDTIVCAYEDDENDPNYPILDSNYKILENAVDRNASKFKIVKLPMPHMNYDNGEKAPVSYANFYIGNNVVLMSVFNDKNDQKAIDIISSVFKDRKIIPIDCSKIIYGGGAIHCMTMQQP